jgi:hypothetical protein
MIYKDRKRRIDRLNAEIETRLTARPRKEHGYPRFAPLTDTLVVFVDASAQVHAALVFNDLWNLIQVRGDLAIKEQSMPREELNALLMGTLTAGKVVRDQAMILNQPLVRRIVVFTDCVRWLRHHTRYNSGVRGEAEWAGLRRRSKANSRGFFGDLSITFTGKGH